MGQIILSAPIVSLLQLSELTPNEPEEFEKGNNTDTVHNVVL